MIGNTWHRPRTAQNKDIVLKVRKVDARLPGKGNSNSHGARPVHLNITMIKWTWTSRLSIKNSFSFIDRWLGSISISETACENAKSIRGYSGSF
jgi:hypothetical protein